MKSKEVFYCVKRRDGTLHDSTLSPVGKILLVLFLPVFWIPMIIVAMIDSFTEHTFLIYKEDYYKEKLKEIKKGVGR